VHLLHSQFEDASGSPSKTKLARTREDLECVSKGDVNTRAAGEEQRLAQLALQAYDVPPRAELTPIRLPGRREMRRETVASEAPSSALSELPKPGPVLCGRGQR
jgi:hypothetical protein